MLFFLLSIYIYTKLGIQKKFQFLIDFLGEWNVVIKIIYSYTFGIYSCSMKEQEKVFWEQGDFGYVKKRIDSMKTYCESTEEKVI